MSRCKCCDVPLTGMIRYKSNDEFEGMYVEEDMCTACIFISDNSEYIDVKTYQFGDITEYSLNLIDYNENS